MKPERLVHRKTLVHAGEHPQTSIVVSVRSEASAGRPAVVGLDPFRQLVLECRHGCINSFVVVSMFMGVLSFGLVPALGATSQTGAIAVTCTAMSVCALVTTQALLGRRWRYGSGHTALRYRPRSMCRRRTSRTTVRRTPCGCTRFITLLIDPGISTCPRWGGCCDTNEPSL